MKDKPMPKIMLDINDSSRLRDLHLDEKEVLRIIQAVLKAHAIAQPIEVSLSIVSDTEIQAINKQWRGVDSPTDVISIECEGPNDACELGSAPLALGDIVLSPAYIARQAQRLHTSLKSESTLLLVHAMLHLLGYNHEEEAEARHMEEQEEALLTDLAKGQ